jgi:hypothetical protein
MLRPAVQKAYIIINFDRALGSSFVTYEVISRLQRNPFRQVTNIRPRFIAESSTASGKKGKKSGSSPISTTQTKYPEVLLGRL